MNVLPSEEAALRKIFMETGKTPSLFSPLWPFLHSFPTNLFEAFSFFYFFERQLFVSPQFLEDCKLVKMLGANAWVSSAC